MSLSVSASTSCCNVSSPTPKVSQQRRHHQKLQRRRGESVVSRGFLDDIKEKVQSLRPDSKSAGIYGAQGRDDYEDIDVEYYFNYMGMLAIEGSYDRMNALMKTGIHPCDALLLFASEEGDVPKVTELLEAGADRMVKNVEGETSMDVAGKKNAEKKDAVLALFK